MRILFVGKFPPIQGGVSGQTLWLVHSLAQLGHEVHLVTNADEVEPTFRQFQYSGDDAYLGPLVEQGRLHVHNTSASNDAPFIPQATPYVTKLFGLSLSVLDRYPCDIILSWYFEPYGVVAAMLRKATGLPTIVRHAGSDLGRLAKHPDLASTYRWMLNVVDGVIATNREELFRQFGSVAARFVPIVRPRLPEVFFSAAAPLDLIELHSAAGDWFGALPIDDKIRCRLRAPSEALHANNNFVLGMYGKVGRSKGTIALNDALKALAARGCNFTFISVAAGTKYSLEGHYHSLLEDPQLAKRTIILPPIAPWRIPSFLRCCDAVCFLEHDFPIKFHSPLVPREALSSGACLICSAEIAGKADYGRSLVDDRTAIVVRDPADGQGLSDQLSKAVANPTQTKAIAKQAQKLSHFWEDGLASQLDSARSLAATLREMFM